MKKYFFRNGDILKAGMTIIEFRSKLRDLQLHNTADDNGVYVDVEFDNDTLILGNLVLGLFGQQLYQYQML